MTKVLVFDTLAEAKKDLEQFLYQNRQVSAGIQAECSARLQVYKNSADFYRRHRCPDEGLAADEVKMVFYQAGKSCLFTSVMKLYVQKPLGHYAFDGYHDNWEMHSHSGEWDSICDSAAALVVVAQKHIREQNHSVFGVKTTPLFYTVREAFNYSEEEILKIKELENYRAMRAVEQKHFDRKLRAYTERGLTDTEICEFVTGYTRFLN